MAAQLNRFLGHLKQWCIGLSEPPSNHRAPCFLIRIVHEVTGAALPHVCCEGRTDHAHQQRPPLAICPSAAPPYSGQPASSKHPPHLNLSADGSLQQPHRPVLCRRCTARTGRCGRSSTAHSSRVPVTATATTRPSSSRSSSSARSALGCSATPATLKSPWPPRCPLPPALSRLP